VSMTFGFYLFPMPATKLQLLSILLNLLSALEHADRFPARVLRMQNSPPTVACEIRRETAVDILRTSVADLDIFTLKIRLLCFTQLVDAATTGTCQLKLFSLLRSLSGILSVNIEELEGLNGTIKSICDQSPNMSIQLLDAQLRIKKCLSVSGRQDTMSVKELKPIAIAKCQTLTEFVGETLPPMPPGETRYGPPAPIPKAELPSEAAVKTGGECLQPELRVTPKRRWGAAHNMLYMRTAAKSDAKQCLIIREQQQSCEDVCSFWIRVDHLRNIAEFVEMRICAQCNDVSILEPIIPFRLLSSLAVFSSYYDKVHKTGFFADRTAGIRQQSTICVCVRPLLWTGDRQRRVSLCVPSSEQELFRMLKTVRTGKLGTPESFDPFTFAEGGFTDADLHSDHLDKAARLMVDEDEAAELDFDVEAELARIIEEEELCDMEDAAFHDLETAQFLKAQPRVIPTGPTLPKVLPSAGITIARWLSEFHQSHESLKEKLASMTKMPGHNKELSLVSSRSEGVVLLHFVSWTHTVASKSFL
jgi:hypothetical protein